MPLWKLNNGLPYQIHQTLDNCSYKQYDKFVTYLRAENAEFIKQAAADTKFNVYIGKHSKPGYVEVRTQERRDHSPFWDRYAELRDNHAKI